MVFLYVVNLRGGGGDIACDACLADALDHHRKNDAVVSVARIDSPSEECGWCGASPGQS